ncbi:sugar ABC transporter substrate-binding protein [Thermoanaerobacterium thermosaccharolyticum]|uniref:ABC transporter substrate-binding protein n=1 Tax=Thermoanaerobacterium thermosaccharolyticum TaxID=1517 RepID=UPI000C07F58D|nr:sugar ABC transporter substrate-binding protein [Thermoanaerobacterium thermosaccharolyticum]PHO08526.1 sugar ABC transporter substrate-binding protein [Thermoanaerobacterium thermosaccharolyticum]
MFKSKMLKMINVLLVLVLIITSFTACGNNSSKSNSNNAKTSSNTAEKITLQFWTISLRPKFDNYFNDLFAKYKKLHPNVEIKWTDLPYDAIQNKLVASTAGNDVPDVVNLNTDMALQLAAKGALVDLNKEATDEQKSIYIKTLWESAKLNNGIYAFPWYGGPSVLVYNKALFEKAGMNPPKTYDELFQMAKEFKDKTGAYLYVPGYFPNEIYFVNGINILNEDKTKAAFNTPETLTLLEKYKEYYQNDIFPLDAEGNANKMYQLFATSKLGMLILGPSSLSRIKDEAPDVYKNIDITQPIIGKSGVIDNAIMDLVVMQKSQHHKEAIDFANFVTNDENQLEFAKEAQVFPSTIKASQDSYFKSNTSTLEGKAVSIAADYLNKSVDKTLGIPNSQDVKSEMIKESDEAFHSQKTPKQALDDAEKNVNQMLSGQ